MSISLPLPSEKKLTIVYRVEPGCLGPKGASHVEDFCFFTQKEFERLDSDYIRWEIEPRNDKSLPELQYKINNKKLTHDKAARYLELFDKNLDEFESHLHNSFALQIEQYLGR